MINYLQRPEHNSEHFLYLLKLERQPMLLELSLGAPQVHYSIRLNGAPR